MGGRPVGAEPSRGSFGGPRLFQQDAAGVWGTVGSVNPDQPKKSLILTWIERAEPRSELITAEVIAEERSAFLEWIEHESACRSCAGVPCASSTVTYCERMPEPREAFEDTDPSRCDDQALERLFRDTVFASRGRCAPCHFESESVPDSLVELAPPGWISTEGSCELASLATMRNVIASGYLDLEAPEESLLLMKPLAEAEGGIEHGGHDKFTANGDDPAYENFLLWISRYAVCATGKSNQQLSE